MPCCLIVDDDENSRYLAVEIAKSCGLEVSEMDNGFCALEYCKKRMPDIIILDWMMPQMNGIDFLKELTKVSQRTAPKIVMCSARFSENDINAGLAAGADEYLKKPVRSRDMISILESFQISNHQK